MNLKFIVEEPGWERWSRMAFREILRAKDALQDDKLWRAFQIAAWM